MFSPLSLARNGIGPPQATCSMCCRTEPREKMGQQQWEHLVCRDFARFAQALGATPLSSHRQGAVCVCVASEGSPFPTKRVIPNIDQQRGVPY